MKQKVPATYEGEVLGVLAYEFPFSNKADVEEKIRKRLSRKKLGTPDPARIALLRKFKDLVQLEIGKQEQSGYYRGPAGRKARGRTLVEMDDFDIPKLTADMTRTFPGIPNQEIAGFVSLAVFIYHML